MVSVRIPSPLRSYTDEQTTVEAAGATVAELLDDLDRHYAGIRFRMVDEQDRIRPHMRIFVGDELSRDLRDPVESGTTVTIMQALSGG